MKKKLLDGFFFFSCILILVLLLTGGGTAPLKSYSSPKTKTHRPAPVEEEGKLEPVDIHLVAFGDYMIHRPQIRAASQPEGLDFKENFKYLKDNYIQPADISLLNLETTIAEGQNYSTYPVFASPVEILRDMEDAGFNLLATSNNHCFDKGVAGIDRTLDAIEAHNMKGFGTYRQGQSHPLIHEVKGVKLGFAAYTYGINGFESTLANSDNPNAVSFLDEDRIREDVDWLKSQGAEALIFYVHWGVEYIRHPNEVQRQWMNFFADQGVDVVLGSHPHLIQEMEILDWEGHKTYGVYSMGNFVSNQRREYMGQSYSESGLMMDINLHRDEDGKVTVTKYDPVPLLVDYYHDERGSHYEVLPVKDSLEGEIEIPRLEVMRSKLEQSLEQFYELYPDRREAEDLAWGAGSFLMPSRKKT